MCKVCGCNEAEVTIDSTDQHVHHHIHSEAHSNADGGAARLIEIEQNIL